MLKQGSKESPPTLGQIRILVADDHAVVRLGLRMLLQSQADMKLVAEASNAAETLSAISAHRPELILLDLRMPGVHGTSLLQSIRNTHPDIKVVIFTSHATEEDIYQSLHHGACGYLVKEVPREEIVRAIHDVYQGKRWIPPQIAAHLAERVHRLELTDREHMILKLLVKGKSNRDISQELTVREGTVKNHMNNLFSKLGATDRLQAVHIAIERGLASIPEDE